MLDGYANKRNQDEHDDKVGVLAKRTHPFLDRCLGIQQQPDAYDNEDDADEP